MRRLAALLVLVPGLVLAAGAPAAAQDPPPRIGLFVLDLRGSLPSFPDDPTLAASRGLAAAELPGRAFGVDLGLHLYLLRWNVLTVGLGAQATLARARSSPTTGSSFRAVTEQLVSVAPQLSLNFGSGDGWSYLSGGVGRGQWSLIPEGGTPGPADVERLKTVNYGGGARWFSHPHVAFTFDVRFHIVAPGAPQQGLPGSPRTTLVIMSAGMSLK